MSVRDASESLPTEQRIRQKERQKAGHLAKKKPQIVEDHHDDCGEDFGLLDDDYFAEEDPYEGMEPLTSDSEDEMIMEAKPLGLVRSDSPSAPADLGEELDGLLRSQSASIICEEGFK